MNIEDCEEVVTALLDCGDRIFGCGGVELTEEDALEFACHGGVEKIEDEIEFDMDFFEQCVYDCYSIYGTADCVGLIECVDGNCRIPK